MPISWLAIMRRIEQYPAGHHLLTFCRILVLLIKHFDDKKIPTLAQSLAYTTIFTLVPILAIFFAVLGKVTQNTEVQVKIQEFIEIYLLPEYVQWIFTTLENLSTDSFVFGAIGFPTLFLTGVFLYVKVDSSINEIWLSNKQSQWFRNGLAFFMTLFFGPMILVLVFSIPPYLQNLPFVSEMIRQTRVDTVITQLIPLLVLFLGLSFLYLYIPGITVSFGAAIRGAFTAAAVIQVSNFLISVYLKSFARMDVFYGSLATIPILLLYVYVFWMTVLSGAALTFILQYYRGSNYMNPRGLYNDESLLSSALRTMVYLVQCFERRDEAPNFEKLQLMLGMNRKRLAFVLETLRQHRLLTVFEEGKGKHNQTLRYQPGLAPDRILLKDLVPVFYHPQHHVVFDDELNRTLQTLDVHPGFENGDLSLQDLLRTPSDALLRLS
jgi:membrane protein